MPASQIPRGSTSKGGMTRSRMDARVIHVCKEGKRMLRSLGEIFETLCVSDILEWTERPEESDFVPRSAEDEILDELFIGSWIAKRKRGMR